MTGATVTAVVAARHGSRRRVAPVRPLPGIDATVSPSTPPAWTLNASINARSRDDDGRRHSHHFCNNRCENANSAARSPMRAERTAL